MSFGSFSCDDDVMHEINMTPLVDVMLVLLIIFMITVPVIQHSVKIDLPRATNRPLDRRPPHVRVVIHADGRLQWDGTMIQIDDLARRIAAATRQAPQPELHLYADRHTPYERVARVMAMAHAGGLHKIGFVLDPDLSER